MVNSIALLSTAQSPYAFNERGDVAMMLFNQEIAKMNYFRTDRNLDTGSDQSEKTHRKKQRSDPSAFNRKGDINGFSGLKLLPDPSNRLDSTHGRTDGSDSHEGIGKIDVTVDGRIPLMSKIPAHDGTRRMWNLVESLRGDKTLPNASNRPKGSRLVPDHKISSPHKAKPHSNQFIDENPTPTSSNKTMIAQRLPKEYLPTRHIDMSNEDSPSRPSRRARSRAIAIQRPSRSDEADEIRQSTVAAEYDWATWRMYNRIIDHRQKYPLNYQSSDKNTREEHSSSSTSGHGTSVESTFPSSQEYENLTMEQSYPEYGEVFELDL